jgi:glutamate mutase epsilon subunit
MNQATNESLNQWSIEANETCINELKKTEYMNRLINEQRIDKAKIVFQSIKESVQ